MFIENNEDNKRIIKAVLILIVGLAIGVLVTSLFYRSKIKKLESSSTQATQTKNGLPAIPAPPEMPEIPVPDQITSISGTVKKIDGRTLTIDANVFGTQKTYIVTAGNDTKITKSEMKQNYQPKEDETFNPFAITDAKLADIRENDSVSVEASENIKDKTSFEAKTVVINISNLPAIPPPPAMPDIENIPIPDPPTMPDLPSPPSIK